MHPRIFLLLVLATFPFSAAAAPQCSAEAISQAHKLLAFHFGEDDRISIEDQARELPAIRNPADPKQKFSVLEVWGYIYKGEYRMRFIYYRLKQDCVLMGQEILESAKL